MKFLVETMKRPMLVTVAAALAVSALVPALVASKANALQVKSRSITMSQSALSATAVDYEVSFKVGQTSATTFKGFVVEFCDDSPLPGISCDATAGRVPSISSVATPLAGLSAGASSLTGGWTGAGTGTNIFKLTDATGNLLDDGDANYAKFKFQATNPTASTGSSGHSFYARIYGYVDDQDVDGGDTGGADSPAAFTGGATTGTYLDQGGIALSTANQISITTRVQETLKFCVTKSATTDCTVDTPPVLDIGHGVPKVIDSTAVDTDTAVFGLSTNATSGATIRLKGKTLESGSNNIDPVGAAASTITFSNTTERFGLNVAPGAGVTADPNYAGVGNYGFDTTATTAGYGDIIATTTGPVNAIDSSMTFAATAALTTPAGLYTTTLDLIATGVY